MSKTDYIIVGAGIVGLATALKLFEVKPKSKILILEKENQIGKHQTGNNSGVIHSGIYYKPGSLKAENCIRGYKLLLDFCDKHEIKYDLCGKLIVATNKNEETILEKIYSNGIQNGLSDLKIIEENEIKNYEPYAKGTKAIQVSQTGIIDFKVVLRKYSEQFQNLGGTLKLNSKVAGINEKSDEIEVTTESETHKCDFLITCSGLQSDRIAKMTCKNLNFRIIPFRGEYYKLKKDKTHLVSSLIYPVPDPSFPFLGVHFTKKINGEVEAGPNAVLSLKREGYKKNSFNFSDALNTFAFSGFRKIAAKYWKTGLGEFYRSYSKNAFTAALQKLVPEITQNDLIPGGAGVRAQICDNNGILLDDFKFLKSKRILHVINAPSPAATASLAVGEKIVSYFLS